MTVWERTELASTRVPAPLLAALGVAIVLLLGVGVVTVRGEVDAASATTRLVEAESTVLVGIDGRIRPAAVGDSVEPGETVRAAPGGMAVTDTRGRIAVLPGGSALTVLDGVSAVLEQGSIGVDDRSGAGLTLTVGPLLVRPDGVVRVDRGFATRVAVAEGSAGVTGSTGDELVVPRLRQVLVPARTVPRETPPLALLDDALDRRMAPDLLAADKTLTSLADGLEIGPTGLRLAAVVPVRFAQASITLSGPLEGAAARVSEIALPLAVAQVSTLSQAPEDRYATVRDLRAEGGSWGVVAGLALAPAGEVGAAVAALLEVPGAGEGADLLATAPQAAVPGAPPAPAPAAAPAPAGQTGAVTAPAAPRAPAPAAPAPAPQPGPLQQLLTVVGDTVPTGPIGPSGPAVPVAPAAPPGQPAPAVPPSVPRPPVPTPTPAPVATPSPVPVPILPRPPKDIIILPPPPITVVPGVSLFRE